ncbi:MULTISPECIES: hypothetical protein [unclassified Streptomyces]|uniref:hypothetical protein n=1 Tax=unclassified Streptomyces TaxID=2593676 RepID=UPI0035D5DB09
MATPLATTVVLSAERAGSVVNTLLDTAVPSLALSLHDESEEPLYARHRCSRAWSGQVCPAGNRARARTSGAETRAAVEGW